MAYEEYFTNEDKPYSENLNDALLLLDAFDVTVPVKMPDMFSNGEFTSNLNLARKCGVGIITLISKGSGVTIGTNTITGTGEVVFRVYPNFNGFYKWQSIILQKTNTVNVAFRKPDGSSISATVSSDGTISDNNALKQLLEVDLVLTLTNATISSILINFINNHTKTDRVSALLEASQLANVNGSVATGNTEAVNGGTVKTALDDLHSTVSDEIDDLSDDVDGRLSTLSGNVDTKLALKEDKANKVTSLTNSDTQYPSSNAVKTVADMKENLSNKVTTLDSSDSHYPSSKAVKTVTDSKANKEWTTVPTTKGTLEVNESLKLAHFVYSGEITGSTETWVTIQKNNIPVGYRPSKYINEVEFTASNHFVVSVSIDKNGTLYGYMSSASSPSVSIDTLWKYP